MLTIRAGSTPVYQANTLDASTINQVLIDVLIDTRSSENFVKKTPKKHSSGGK